MNKALFVVDVQEFYKNKQTKVVIEEIRSYLRKYENKYSLIIFTVFQNDSTSPVWKTLGWKKCSSNKETRIVKELNSFVNQHEVVTKNTYSVLKSKKVLQQLKNYKIDQVDLCGFETDCCILATAYDLFDLGYKAVILENLCATTSKDKLHNPAISVMRRNIGFIKRV